MFQEYSWLVLGTVSSSQSSNVTLGKWDLCSEHISEVMEMLVKAISTLRDAVLPQPLRPWLSRRINATTAVPLKE